MGMKYNLISIMRAGAEVWRERIPHEVGYGPHREIPMAVDRVSAGGIKLARY